MNSLGIHGNVVDLEDIETRPPVVVRRVSSRVVHKVKRTGFYDGSDIDNEISPVKKRKRSKVLARKTTMAGKSLEMKFNMYRKEGGEEEDNGNEISPSSTSACDLGVQSDDFGGPEFKLDLTGKDDKEKVKETLRLFNAYYLRIAQLEETRCGREHKSGKSGSKDAPKKGSEVKPYLVCACTDEEVEMMQTKTILFPEKQFGALPGVEVGQQFLARCEMVALGLHGHWINGIDYMSTSYADKEKYKGYAFPLAVSIVISGQYEDDVDNADDVVYTGQGGNDLKGSGQQSGNQRLLRGNLALKHNVDNHVPVRVIRGHKSKHSLCGKVYTYDGLYKVVNYWAEKGISGFTVYKFRLKRLEGQPPLTTKQVTYSRGHVPNCISELRGLVCDDISGRKEAIPIPATNLVDDPPVPPTGKFNLWFRYCKSIELAENVNLPTRASGCGCEGACTDPSICDCAKLNGADFPYIRRDGGRLVIAKSVVYECGPKCGCGDGCVNRTSQNGLKYRFEVFRTPKKGWAVRSWDFIPSGSPTMIGLDGRERRLGDAATHSHPHVEVDDKKLESVPEFCIDAGQVGNVARFINHSCDPNLFVQCVLSSHQNVKLARVMLFAAENIPPLQELAYDYGYPIGSVLDAEGNVREMACHCGADKCRKRLF
ncbi:hypothetical protein C5167_022244 [Papaver somniferum]|uniref:Histone-lysine N-methyltransferase n=1 Tax=Papaver somniferum TaxID=3469 RepID=A0A4Y7JHE8_PAPSO|nr:hypothetical protein C5167_022244 [Papaver somniferum]